MVQSVTSEDCFVEGRDPSETFIARLLTCLPRLHVGSNRFGGGNMCDSADSIATAGTEIHHITEHVSGMSVA